MPPAAGGGSRRSQLTTGSSSTAFRSTASTRVGSARTAVASVASTVQSSPNHAATTAINRADFNKSLNNADLASLAQTSSASSNNVGASKKHWPRNTTPSFYSQEKPYMSDTTGPLHLSLRGSRPFVYPRPSVTEHTAEEDRHVSNPNARSAEDWVFRHGRGAINNDWEKDRGANLQSTTKADFVKKDRRGLSSAPTAGKGGRRATAAAESSAWIPKVGDVVNGSVVTPLQALAAARSHSLAAAAQALQRKVEGAQVAADKLFEVSAKARYERVAKANAVTVETLTNPFFLSQPAPTNTDPSLRTKQGRSQIRSAEASRPELGLAGLNSKRYRSWDADPNLRLVKRAEGRDHDEFSKTFQRMMSEDHSGASMMAARSTAKESMREGLESKEEGGFVPHFLAKVDVSLHNNIRRNVFNNGNTLFDASKVKFQPRAYNTPEGIRSAALAAVSASSSSPLSPSQASPSHHAAASSSSSFSAPSPSHLQLSPITESSGGGSGFVGM